MNSLMPPIMTYTANAGSMFFLGCGTAYIIEEKKYEHLPIFVLFPSIYCGYNMYKNRDKIIKYILKPT